MSLDVFRVPSANVTVQGYRNVKYNPSSTGITPISFSIPALDDFVDLNRSFLEVELKLNSASTNGIVADANAPSDANNTRFVYVTNNLGHTLFKQMNLRFNGTLMSEQTDKYAYNAFLETLLNYNRDEGETLLAPQGWVNYLNVTEHLTAGGAAYDICTTNGWGHGDATPLKTATVPFYNHNKATLIVHPHLEAFRTGRVLVPGVEIVLELFCNRPEFFLFGTNTSGVGVKRQVTLSEGDLKVTLHLCCLCLNPSVYNALQAKRKVKEQWANYPVVRSEIRTFSFDGRTTKFMEDNLFVGRVPDRMIVGLLDSRGFNGDLEYYPFAFQKFGVIRIRQVIDSEEYPYPTLELNGANGRKDLLGYHCFLEVSDSLLNHRPSMIQPSEWGQDKNCTLFAFNNVPNGDADAPGHRNPRQAGNVRLEIDFRAIRNKNLTVVVWGEFENVFQIDDKGGILYNVRR